jgi:PAS domain S-box-containing protein
LKQVKKGRSNFKSKNRLRFDLSAEAIKKMSPKDIKELIHHFQLHQTELEMQNEELRKAQFESEAYRLRYYELYNNSPISYFTLDKTGKILELNIEAGKMLNMDRDLVLNSSIYRFIREDSLQNFKNLLNRVIEKKEKQVDQINFTSKSGEVIYAQLEIVAIESAINDQIYCRIAVIDFTHKRITEDVLTDTLNLTQKIAAANPSIIYVYDTAKKKTIYLNPAFGSVLNYNFNIEGGLSEKFISSIIHPHDLPLLKDRRQKFKTLKEKEVIESEFRIKNARGEWVWLYSKEIIFKEDPADGSKQILGIALDVSKLKDIEFELIEKNEELSRINSDLDRFVYSASHDLRAPLVSIIGLINVAKMENTDKNTSTYLNLMLKSIHKLDNFIQDLISFSRNSRMSVENQIIDFQDMINDILDGHKYFDGSEKIEKIIKIDINEEFYSDQTRLNIILSNLISNAIRYHNYSRDEPYIAITVNTEKGKAIIEVKDNGQGIGEEHLDKIFEIFYRASSSKTGSGLGLYIVKEAINKLQGNISLKSTINQGSCFTVEIPNQAPESSNKNLQKNSFEASQIPINFKN